MHPVRPVVIPNTVRLQFHSEVNQRQYALSVALPLATAVDVGCPAFYVLDGDWYFASAVELIRANAPGVVVVGIGYPDDDGYIEGVLKGHQPLPVWAKDMPAFRVAVGLERMYDLSLPASEDALAREFFRNWNLRARHVGGLESFLRVLEREIKPRVAAMAAIDSSNQVIFGHSLGGLAVVHALFVEPNAFRTFIAASPSLWWSGKAVLGGEERFADVIRSGEAAPRVLITAGSEEGAPDPKVAARLAVEFGEYSGRIRLHRMVENACELAERLKALCGAGAFEVEGCIVFPKLGHGISPWPALARAVSFAFPS